MADYLLIESRDPFEFASVNSFLRMAIDLKRAGHNVTLFLVQNGVLPCRKGVRTDEVSHAASTGVAVLADDFSLKERAISSANLVAGVKAAPLDVVLDKLEAGAKVLWH